jgi:hypothetical protein
MAYYDPETLVLLRKAFDDAWEALPDGSKSQTLKSEIANRILKQAADGVRTQSDFALPPSFVP